MKKILLLIMVFSFSLSLSMATEVKQENVIYKYKKYEKFDFEDLVIEGETGSPGDLSVLSRHQRQFQNKLPYRKNFNAEIRKAIERVR